MRVRVGTGTALAAVLAMAVGTVAAAASGPAGGATTFAGNAILGDRTFRGFFVDTGDAISVKQRRDGQQIAAASTTAADGSFSVRLKPILAGDRLVVTQDGATRTVTVPDLRLAANASTDRVAGRIPVGDPEAIVTLARQVGPYSLGGYLVEAPTAANGTFSKNLDPEDDLQGGERVELSWSNDTDDVIRVRTAAPSVTVQVGRSTVEVYGPRGVRATITLKTRGGAVRGTATVTQSMTGAAVTGTFRKNGAAVKVKAGDRVIHSGASSLPLTVVTPTLDLTAPSGGSIHAMCFVGGHFILASAFGNGAFSYLADGVVGPGGIAIDGLIDSSDPLPSGFRVLLICETSEGFAQTFPDAIP